MTLAETGLRYWRDELRALQDEIAGNNCFSSRIDPALKGDLRKAVRRMQQYQKKVAREAKTLPRPGNLPVASASRRHRSESRSPL
jgi:hypothetical protein